MYTHNPTNKHDTSSELVNHYETAIDDIEAISEDEPELALRLYKELRSELDEVIQQVVEG